MKAHLSPQTVMNALLPAIPVMNATASGLHPIPYRCAASTLLSPLHTPTAPSLSGRIDVWPKGSDPNKRFLVGDTVRCRLDNDRTELLPILLPASTLKSCCTP